MNDTKISSKLLSWALGEKVKSNVIEVNTICIETGRVNSFCDIRCAGLMTQHIHGHSYKINLHTFIHLTKIKACEKGFSFEIDTDYEYLYVSCLIDKIKLISEMFTYISPLDIETDLKALEWVAEKVGGKNGKG